MLWCGANRQLTIIYNIKTSVNIIKFSFQIILYS